MEKVKILWIDDNINNTKLRPYIDELKENDFEIIPAENPDESDRILAERQDFRCIIVDLIMPRGSDEAKYGLNTGLIVLKKLVDNEKLANVKKVVFTIRKDNDAKEVIDYCEENKNNNVYFLKKDDYYPDSFVEKIKLIIDINQ